MSKATQENIKRLLAITGATHQQIADIAGVDRSAVSHWKSGKSEPRMGHLQRIADHFGITTANLINIDGMRYVHKGRDGRLHDDNTAKLDGMKSIVMALDEKSSEVELLQAAIALRQAPMNVPKLSKDESEIIDMYRCLSDEGRHIVMSVMASMVKAGLFSD